MSYNSGNWLVNLFDQILTGFGATGSGSSGIGSFWNSITGQGSDWERTQADIQERWATRNWERENEWRGEDINLAQRWRNEDIERNTEWRNEDIDRAERWRNEDLERSSLQYKMNELKEAGLHPSLGAGGFGSGGGGGYPGSATGMGFGRFENAGGSTGQSGAIGAGGATGSLNDMMSPMVEIARMKNDSIITRGQSQLLQAQAFRERAEGEQTDQQNKEYAEWLKSNPEEIGKIARELKALEQKYNIDEDKAKRLQNNMLSEEGSFETAYKDAKAIGMSDDDAKNYARNLAQEKSILTRLKQIPGLGPLIQAGLDKLGIKWN